MGTEPDLLEEAARWQSDDFWEYALYAAASYIRAVASQAGVPRTADMPGPGPSPRPPRAITPITARLAKTTPINESPSITAVRVRDELEGM
jgi:hypothetical protein